MNKTTPAAEVEMLNGKAVRCGDVLNEKALPVILQGDFSEDTLNEWLKKRKIPENRVGLKNARLAYPGFERYRNMFSLSDQYWFKYTQKESWERGNYFTNRYQTDTGKIFMMPWEVDEKNLKAESPDLTTNGVLIKRWVQDEKTLKSYLIKTGNRHFHQEPISEVLASITLQKIDLVPFVPYKLIADGLRICSICPNFVTEDTEFVPAAHIYKKRPKEENDSVYTHLVKMCELYEVPGAKDFIDNMIAADYLICNTDRHLNNFGFIRDANTFAFIGPAPLFDCGSAFFDKKSKDKMETSRIFINEEEAALDKVIRNGFDPDILETNDIFRMIDMYPALTPEKRKEIKDNVTYVYSHIVKKRKRANDSRTR